MYQVLYKSGDPYADFWKIWATVATEHDAREVAQELSEDLDVETEVVEIPHP